MAKQDPKAPVTKEMLDQVVDAILKGVERMFKEQDKRFDKLEAGQKNLQRQVSDLKYDTTTQKEFEELKTRVDKYHPI